VAALALALAALLSGTSGRSSPPSSSGPTSQFDGAELPLGAPAPNFTLTDQHGRAVSLLGLRGHVIVLTFLSSSCGPACVLIAQQIRGTLDQLSRPVSLLIVSVDPRVDAPASIRSFLAEVSLSGRALYLTGPPARLRAIWREYRITPASAGRKSFDRHASVLLLDPQGRIRVLYQQEQLTPEALAHDIGKLQNG
jgi:protein SCO1